GIVPTPKRTIYKPLCRGLANAKAPKSPIYTIPQGRRPFKRPMENRAEVLFFFNCFPRAVLALDIQEKLHCDILLLRRNFMGISTAKILKIPLAVDQRCCISATKSPFPTQPNKTPGAP